MSEKPVIAQTNPLHDGSRSRNCLLVSMRSIENATVLRWIPYGDGVFADGGSF